MVDKVSYPAFSMGSAPRKIEKPDGRPGPGSYSTTTFMKVNQHHKSKQSNENRFKGYSTIVPGPGSYSHEIKEHIPNATIKSRCKDKAPEAIPGPGSYQADYRKVMKTDGGYIIPKSHKHQDLSKNLREVPGPGNYETAKSTLIGLENAAKFGHEKKIVIDNKIPGPGAYSTDYLQPKSKASTKSSFSRQNRSQSMSNLVPGPGAYSTKNCFDESKQKGFSISLKNSQKKKNEINPGPGAYKCDEIDKLKYKTTSFTVSKERRLKIQNQRQILAVPGPDRYNINTDAFRGKSFAMSKSQRKGLGVDNYVPGPGTYEKSNTNHLPQFSIPKAKYNVVKPSMNPGPCDYTPMKQYNQQNKAVGINVDNRRPYYDQKKGVPGPGSYTMGVVDQKTKGGFTIGHQKRSKNLSTNVPGPGNYNIPTTVSNIPNYSK